MSTYLSFCYKLKTVTAYFTLSTSYCFLAYHTSITVVDWIIDVRCGMWHLLLTDHHLYINTECYIHHHHGVIYQLGDTRGLSNPIHKYAPQTTPLYMLYACLLKLAVINENILLFYLDIFETSDTRDEKNIAWTLEGYRNRTRVHDFHLTFQIEPTFMKMTCIVCIVYWVTSDPFGISRSVFITSISDPFDIVTVCVFSLA